METAMSDLDLGPEGVWLSITEIARRKGVSKQALSKRVKSLEADDKVTVRRRGQSVLVDLVEYDRAVGDFGDAGREAAAETVRAARRDQGDRADPSSSGLRDVQLERARYETRMRALDYAERTGQLVPLRGPGGVEDALVDASAEIIRSLDLTMRHFDKIREATKDGEPAVRRVIKEIIHEQRIVIGKAMQVLAERGRAIEESGGITVNIAVPGFDATNSNEED
jgi:DNA-binding transcriptional ArsR family regulator